MSPRRLTIAALFALSLAASGCLQGRQTPPDDTQTCGDGALDEGEACDPGISEGPGACPTACSAPGACTTSTLVGSAQDCSAACEDAPISQCVGGDGCCPFGCTEGLDSDCGAPSKCGNGVVDPGETCDGNCPTSCSDGNTCTSDRLAGSASQCNAVCEFDPILTCQGGDGCCPGGCTSANDSDCQGPVCGNNTVEAGETCDGNCPTSCNDNQACTSDRLLGSASQCDALCEFSPVTTCRGGDGCCPGGCTGANDSDCALPAAYGQACNRDTDCDSQVCYDQGEIGWLNGYCSEACLSDASCPGGHCAFMNNGSGICVQPCATAADCPRAGYACLDRDADGKKECTGIAAGAGAVGDACEGRADCAGGGEAFCSATGFEGYCTRPCDVLSPCPSGSHCGFQGQAGGYCIATCVTDTDCRDGNYTCRDIDADSVKECWHQGTGAGVAGDPCIDLQDCESRGGGGRCLPEADGAFRGGYCSNWCQSDSDCASSARCGLVQANGWGTCLDRCLAHGDCRGPGYACLDLEKDGGRVCYAYGNGAQPMGASCGGLWDCNAGAGARCVNRPEAPICSQSCTVGATGGCPAGFTCFSGGPQGTPGLCVSQCTTGSDCPGSYSCAPGSICLY